MPGFNGVLFPVTSPEEGLVLLEGEYLSDFSMSRHAHDDFSIVFILKGTVQHECRNQRSTLTPSTVVVLPAGEPHADRFAGGVRALQVVLKERWLERIRQAAAIVDTPTKHQNSLPNWIAARLYQEFQQRDSLTPLMLEGLTLELLVGLSREGQHLAESRTPIWLRQARDYLHDHFTEGPSLETIAAAVAVHPAHLTRAFRQHFHCTLGEYARRLRVEFACHQLATSNKPLLEIALEAGFADQSHFARTFRSSTGVTPAQFRRSAGNAAMGQKLLS